MAARKVAVIGTEMEVDLPINCTMNAAITALRAEKAFQKSYKPITMADMTNIYLVKKCTGSQMETPKEAEANYKRMTTKQQAPPDYISLASIGGEFITEHLDCKMHIFIREQNDSLINQDVAIQFKEGKDE